MNEMTFRLTHHRTYYRDLFHQNDFNFFTKNSSALLRVYVLFAFILFTAAVYVLSMVMPSIAWLVPVGMSGIIGGVAITCQIFFKYASWKYYVHKYSKHLSAHSTSVIAVNEHGLRVKYGQMEHEYPWSHFDLTKISDSYIILTNRATSSLVIPTKCMDEADFRILKAVLAKKLPSRA